MKVIAQENRSAFRRLIDRALAFGADESGATAIEYALIVALVFLAVVGAVRSYTETTSGMYGTITETLDEQVNGD